MGKFHEHNATILVYGAHNNKSTGAPHIARHKMYLSVPEQRTAQKRINAYYAKLVKERNNANSDVAGSAHLRGVPDGTLKEAAYLYMTGYHSADWHG